MEEFDREWTEDGIYEFGNPRGRTCFWRASPSLGRKVCNYRVRIYFGKGWSSDRDDCLEYWLSGSYYVKP